MSGNRDQAFDLESLVPDLELLEPLKSEGTPLEPLLIFPVDDSIDSYPWLDEPLFDFDTRDTSQEVYHLASQAGSPATIDSGSVEESSDGLAGSSGASSSHSSPIATVMPAPAPAPVSSGSLNASLENILMFANTELTNTQMLEVLYNIELLHPYIEPSSEVRPATTSTSSMPQSPQGFTPGFNGHTKPLKDRTNSLPPSPVKQSSPAKPNAGKRGNGFTMSLRPSRKLPPLDSSFAPKGNNKRGVENTTDGEVKLGKAKRR